MAFAQQLKKQLKSSICLLLGLRWAFGGGILGGCASSLPVLRIHPQFCHSRSLEQWYFERKKLFINNQFKRIQNLWVFVWFTKLINYPSLSSEYILSSATATHLISDILREFFLIYLKGLKIYGFCSQVQQLSLPVLRIHPQFCHSHELEQWYFERKKGLLNDQSKRIQNLCFFSFTSSTTIPPCVLRISP